MKIKITPPKRGAYRYKRKKGECVGRSYAPRPRRRKPTKMPVCDDPGLLPGSVRTP